MQPRRIVVGIDFSDASLAAARWAAFHFAPDAEVVLVHVASVPWVPSFARAHLRPPAEISAAVGPTLYGALHGLAELVDPGRTRVEVVAGSPADALAVVAEELAADAICVGRGSRRRGSARFGATTPQRLLARTSLPTLVVPARTSAAPAHSVVGVEERSGGRYVLGAACRLAAAYGASIDALHVIEPDVEDFVSMAGDGPDPHTAWLRDSAQGWLNRLLDDVGGVNRAKSVIRFGDAGSEIVRRARESGADLVVIGRGGDATRTQTPTAGPVLGSTARLVAWAAPCPVLVVPVRAPLLLAPLPPERERSRHQHADVIPLRNPSRGSSGGVPPAAHRGRAGEAECA